MPEPLDHARVVGRTVASRATCRVRAQRASSAVEALRGLHGAQPRPLRGGDDRLGLRRPYAGSTSLTVSGERQRRDDGGRSVPYGLDHRVHGVDGHKRAGGVVHEHDVDVVGERVEAEAYGLLAGLTAGDDQEVGRAPRQAAWLVEQVTSPRRRRRAGRPRRRGRRHGTRPWPVRRGPAWACRSACAAPWGRRGRGARPGRRPGSRRRCGARSGASRLCPAGFYPEPGRIRLDESVCDSPRIVDIGSRQVCVLGRRGYGHSVPGATP